MTQSRKIVLASSSAYRRELLGRLRIPFDWARPDADETPLPDEPPEATAVRLAEAKAKTVAGAYPHALIIGSDQVASCEGRRLDKPGTYENATAQLRWLSGKEARFDTAVSLLDARDGRIATRLVGCQVRFRTLDPARIEAYLACEQPYDCAGSAKSEGLGIALLSGIDTTDPTSLIGLPLIALCDLLEEFGCSPI
ncbi:MAG: Maf family nucleotide pyrophosphatase [Betaproteobacteria bacterium]